MNKFNLLVEHVKEGSIDGLKKSPLTTDQKKTVISLVNHGDIALLIALADHIDDFELMLSMRHEEFLEVELDFDMTCRMFRYYPDEKKLRFIHSLHDDIRVVRYLTDEQIHEIASYDPDAFCGMKR